MKRLLYLVLALFIVLSTAACSNSTTSDKQVEKEIEKVLGDYKQLPMDIDDIKEKLSDNVLVESSAATDDEDTKNTTIVVGDGVVLYSSATEDVAKSANGSEFSYKVTVIHLGSATEGKDGAYSLHFIGANITMEIGASDSEAVRQELLSQIDQMELSGEDASLMKDLINGKQIYASTSSNLWELYSEVSVDVQATYDAETNSFVIKEEDTYDEMLDQYCYELVDFKGRVSERVYYKIDDSGTKWITEKYEFTYLSNGSVKEHSVSYYEYTDQIWTEDEYLKIDESIGGRLWSREYLDDGTLSVESYIDENGNDVLIEYFNDGSISCKRISLPSASDDQPGEEIYSEEYASPGKLWRKFIKDDTKITEEFYFQNGCLQEATTRDTSRMTDDGYMIIQIKKGEETGVVEETNYDDGKIIGTATYWADGSKTVTDYENELPILSTTYFANGKTQTVTEYENGNKTKSTQYREDGSLYCTVKFVNGRADMTFYDENGNIIDLG